MEPEKLRGGGFGRQATIVAMPPMSTVTAFSASMATITTLAVAVFAPLCGSICNLKSFNLAAEGGRENISFKSHTITIHT